MQFTQLAPTDDWGNLQPPKIKINRENSGSNRSREEEKGSNEWNQKINKHGSFHTPMVKNSENRRESSVWGQYNNLEERRKESDDWGSDLRK